MEDILTQPNPYERLAEGTPSPVVSGGPQDASAMSPGPSATKIDIEEVSGVPDVVPVNDALAQGVLCWKPTKADWKQVSDEDLSVTLVTSPDVHNQRLDLGEYAPPEATLEVRAFVCGACSTTSYARLEDARTSYLVCVHCARISTVRPTKTRRTAYMCLIFGILSSLLGFLGIIGLILLWTGQIQTKDNRHHRTSFVFIVVGSGISLFFKYRTLSKLPVGKLEEEVLLYRPFKVECERIDLMNRKSCNFDLSLCRK